MAHPPDSCGNHERQAMIDAIVAEAQRLPRDLREAVHHPGVLAAMAAVPRDAFVPAAERADAYANRPLPIGHGQTISQPLMVAIMTGLLRPERQHRVLEIGTGSGYQAAVLARLVAEVYSIEVSAPLARQAAAVLAGLGIENVHVRHGDGRQGWPEARPFASIIVTAAAADEVPAALVEQLAPAGRMVIPLGREAQTLAVIERGADGGVVQSNVLPVRFVPLV